MKFSHNISLKNYNTFGIDVKADKFISVTTVEELKNVLRLTYASELFILGGGSNLLLTRDIHKTVVHIALKGIEVIAETKDHVLVQAMAGENWHEFVLWTLEQDYGGLENLSLIPGNVGTAPIQNIGAYGTELKDVFEACQTIKVQTLQSQQFDLKACDFGYRNSIFKNKLKGEHIITGVTFRLTKTNHKLNTDYGAINTALSQMDITSPSLRDISNAVIELRLQKLPDPKSLGSSGSFFKNPVITEKEFKRIQKKHPEIPFYTLSYRKIKIPAGWLIEKAGLKGYRKGDAGVHKNQALVLVNYGQATGQEILNLALEIQDKIKAKFGVDLDPELNII